MPRVKGTGRAVTAWRRACLELDWTDLLPHVDVSLDAPLEFTDGAGAALEERIAAEGPGPDELADTRQQRIYLDKLAEKAALSKQQTAILRLRYAEDYTRGEVVEKLGITKQAVSAYEKAALAKLKAAVDEDDPKWPR